jgi:cellobiose transport system permease protein
MFWVSLHDWDLLGGHKWVGLGNYSTLMSDADFWNATRNTLGLFVVTAVPQLLLALGMAHALNRRLRSRTLFRMGVLLPNITSVTAVALIFLQLFGRDYGLVNWLFSHVGMHKVDWQVGRWPSWTAITVMVDWRWTGYNALIFLGAMQAIPRDLYEAAAIDGANQWRQFRKITVPLLRPAITFAVIISTIGSIQLFTEPFIFDNTQNANGGSAREFQTLAMYMYQNGILRFKAGYGAAIAWMMFLLVLVIAAINFLLIRRTQRRG